MWTKKRRVDLSSVKSSAVSSHSLVDDCNFSSTFRRRLAAASRSLLCRLALFLASKKSSDTVCAILSLGPAVRGWTQSCPPSLEESIRAFAAASSRFQFQTRKQLWHDRKSPAITFDRGCTVSHPSSAKKMMGTAANLSLLSTATLRFVSPQMRPFVSS